MIAPPYFTRIIIIILLLTITGNAMATQGKINWRSIMTSDEAYTYKPKVNSKAQIKVPTVKVNAKKTTKNFMEGWKSSGVNAKRYIQRQFIKNHYKKVNNN
tara:strand:+ start:30 stop:332 length:303 start_codon:yes stop_codon:yes gene_type:complete